MCWMLCNMRHMARGQSGRIVLEIDPVLKRALHARLAGDGLTLKEWFLRNVDTLLNPKQQDLPLGYINKPATLLMVADSSKPPQSGSPAR